MQALAEPSFLDMQRDLPHTRSPVVEPEAEAICLRDYEGLARSRRMANTLSQFTEPSRRAAEEAQDSIISRRHALTRGGSARQTVSNPRRTMKATRMRCSAAPYGNR